MTTTERSDSRSPGDQAPAAAAVARPDGDRRARGRVAPAPADVSAALADGGARAGARRERTCVGCGERVDKSGAGGAGAELVRLILGPDGEVAVDAGGGGFGHGAYVHPRRDCLAKAATRGLAKAAKGRVSSIVGEDTSGEARAKLTPSSLAEAVGAAMTRRIRGLLTSAGRSRALALGADAVTGAWDRGEAALILVACDAAAGAELPAVRRAVVEGRAVAWGSKLELGALCSGGRGRKPDVGLAVVAVTSSRIASALRDAVRSADACLGPPAERAADAKGAALSGGPSAKTRFGDAAGAAASRRADGSVG